MKLETPLWRWAGQIISALVMFAFAVYSFFLGDTLGAFAFMFIAIIWSLCIECPVWQSADDTRPIDEPYET